MAGVTMAVELKAKGISVGMVHPGRGLHSSTSQLNLSRF